MIDPDLKIQLDQLNDSLAKIKNKNAGGGVWRAFFNGMFGALGYIVGLGVVVVILAWFLQKNGLLGAFEQQVVSFSNLVSSAEKLIPSSQNSSAPSTATQSQDSGGTPTTVTLPNGQQIKLNIQQ